MGGSIAQKAPTPVWLGLFARRETQNLKGEAGSRFTHHVLGPRGLQAPEHIISGKAVSVKQTAATSPRRDILNALWHMASGKSTRLVLLALLALSLVLGGLLPQLPAADAVDPATANRWLSTTTARFGTWGTPLRAVGLFDIGYALWFRLLLALLAFHLLLSAVEAAQTAWAALSNRRRPPLPPSDASHEASASLSPPLREAVDAVRSQLAASGLRVPGEQQEEETPTGAILYADRARIGVLGPLLGNIGALLLLFGMFINSAWGWQTGNLLLAPEQEIALGHDTGLGLRLAPATHAASSGQLLFLDGSGQAIARPLGIARPARYRGISVHQKDDGPALMVRGEDRAGQPLTLHALTAEGTAGDAVSLSFDRPQAERHLTVPDHNLALRIVAQASTSEDQADQVAFMLQVYQGGSSEPIIETSIRESGVLEVDEARFEFRPERYTVLQVGHNPGLAWLFAGGLLILLGVTAPLIWPALQVWAELIPERRAVMVRLAGRAQGVGVDVEEELDRLVEVLGGVEEQAA